MIMCKGDSHDTYGIANYDHVEPVWGLYSNHSLDDRTVYPDDVLVHGADYGAFGAIEGPHLYRRFDGLADSKVCVRKACCCCCRCCRRCCFCRRCCRRRCCCVFRDE